MTYEVLHQAGDSPPPERLYFAYTQTPPPIDEFDVKRVVSADLLGRPAALTIIGASHYIGSRQLGFHELSRIVRERRAVGIDDGRNAPALGSTGRAAR